MNRTITRDQLDKSIRRAAAGAGTKASAKGTRTIFIGLILMN
ncbi:hypothetical protein ACTMTJ_40435 [Phytohabitans sp. LJ34]